MCRNDERELALGRRVVGVRVVRFYRRVLVFVCFFLRRCRYSLG